jgi:hypothetical protein
MPITSGAGSPTTRIRERAVAYRRDPMRATTCMNKQVLR